MSWTQAEEDRRQEQQSSQYLKLAKGGDNAHVVLLSQPQKQDKVNNDNRPFRVYTVEVWNAQTKRKQTFDMAPRAFDALVDLKNRIGMDALSSSVLSVVRTQGPTQFDVNYTWGQAAQNQPYSPELGWEAVVEDMQQAGVAPLAGVQVSARSTPWEAHLQRLRTAPSKETLQEAYTEIMLDIDLPDDAVESIVATFNRRRKYFQSTSGWDQGAFETATDIKNLQEMFVAAYGKAKAKGDAILCAHLQSLYDMHKKRLTHIAEPQL